MGGEKVGLTADGDTFKLDGKDFRILSGAIHYFRFVTNFSKNFSKNFRKILYFFVKKYEFFIKI